jgi:hypothetical protein
LINLSWAIFARKYPLSERRSVPTTDKEIAGRRLEELQHCRVLERWRVRHVDDHGGSIENSS